MSSIAGHTGTGRKLIGPASDLHEVEDVDGLKHTAIVFHDEWRAHPAITDALGVVKGYLESPLVTGLVELTGHAPADGAFLYPTGKVWSVAEIVQALSDRGERGGIRSGLELMYTTGQILTEGAEAGQPQGVYSHGGLTPRRIMVKGDGQVMVIGYGLPQVEILEYHADRQRIPREDSFRYCPPERLEARPEDVSSDVFGLCLIAFEMMTGKPVYDGLVNDIRQQAARGEGSRRLFRFREVLPEPVRNLLTKALRPEFESRYDSGEAFLADVHTLLSDRNVPGPSLLDLMGELQSDQRRVGGALQQGRTQMVEADELRSQLESEQSNPDGAPGRSSANVWKAAKRRRVAPRGRTSDEPALSKASEIAGPDPTSLPSAHSSPPVVEETPADPPQPGQAAEPRWGKAKRQVRRGRGLSVSDDVVLPGPSPIESAEVEPEPVVIPPPGGRRAVRSTGHRDGGVPAPPTVPPTAPLRPSPASVDVTELPPDMNPPDLPSPVYVAPTADDLLLQIRGRPKKPERQKLSDLETSVLSRDDAMEVILGPDEDSDCATVMMTPTQLRAKLSAELNVDLPSVARASKRTSATASGDEQVMLQLELPSGEKNTASLLSGQTVAAAISALVGTIVPLPVDQTGSLQGWYRFEQAGSLVPPRSSLASVSGAPLKLVVVPGDTRVVEVTVVSKGQDVRFSNPMSTVVPVSSLTAHLQNWLALPPAQWELVVEDEALDGDMILADIPSDGVLKVQIRSVGS
jgi:serine/threonine protein kinase